MESFDQDITEHTNFTGFVEEKESMEKEEESMEEKEEFVEEKGEEFEEKEESTDKISEIPNPFTCPLEIIS